MSESLQQRSPAERIDALVAVEAEICRLQAEKLRLVADITDDARARTVDEWDRHWVREELACALRLSGAAATDLLCFAQQSRRPPEAIAMLERGEMSIAHLRVLAEATCGMTDEIASELEARTIARVVGTSVATFRRIVAREVLAVAPQDVEEAHEVAMSQRRVAFTAVAAGMTELWALLPADGASALIDVLRERAANPAPDDERTADQRRADALIELATGPGGYRPIVQVTVSAMTLLALDDAPGDIEGHGPIPATLARRIAADASGTWRRILTDERGYLIDYSARRYRPPTRLADHVVARDRTCRFPNCNRPARRCELDHCIDFALGGETCADNLHALCSRHHHLKHEAAGWELKRTPDGDTDWVSPTGHVYTEPAASYEVANSLPDDPPF